MPRTLRQAQIHTIITGISLLIVDAMPTIKTLLLASLLCFLNATYADVYSWTDKDGKRIYTDKKPGSHIDAQKKSLSTTDGINYYTSTPRKQVSQTKTTPLTAANTSSVNNDSNSQNERETPPRLTEKQCQQDYQRSCDQVNNWRKYAIEHCGNDSRCQDEDYLERQYRPRSTEEILVIARRAAIRNNRRDKNIALFLKKQYTNYCENQAEFYCNNKRNAQCENVMEAHCSDSRDLQDIFAQYDNLSMAEKQQIIKKAKQLSLSSGTNPQAYQKLLASIIDLLIAQATLGI
ncbi:MAG: DUF4124 domain-containing protein [Spongiibacteraceae bacterium]|nr:DUF4124 domain-containing protein [Spongiibacteraceae bacterium]